MRFNYKLFESEVPCEICAAHYSMNNNLYLEAVAVEDFDDGDGLTCDAGETMADLSVNIIPLPPNQCALDTNNNKGLVEMLKSQKIGHDTGKTVDSGFCNYPIWEFSDKEMREFVKF